MISDSFRRKLNEIATKHNLNFSEKALTHVAFSFVLSNKQVAISVYIEETEAYIETEVVHKTPSGNHSYTSRLSPNVESNSTNIFEYASDYMSKQDFDSQKNMCLKKHSSFFQRKRSTYSDLVSDLYCGLILHVYKKIGLQ